MFPRSIVAGGRLYFSKIFVGFFQVLYLLVYSCLQLLLMVFSISALSVLIFYFEVCWFEFSSCSFLMSLANGLSILFELAFSFIDFYNWFSVFIFTIVFFNSFSFISTLIFMISLLLILDFLNSFFSNCFQCKICCCSAAKSCLTLCSMPSFPVLHTLPEIAQIYVHWVSLLILCLLLILLLPSVFPSIRVFSNELALHIKWPNSGASASTVLSMNIQHWFPLGLNAILAVQGTLKSLLQHHNSKASVLQHSGFLSGASCKESTCQHRRSLGQEDSLE